MIPHFAYARSDKKDAPRISIAARLVADLLVAEGADRVLTMTLHSPQVHGFFSVPVDHMNALKVLAGHFRRRTLENTVVVSPDLGNAKAASHFARILELPMYQHKFLGKVLCVNIHFRIVATTVVNAKRGLTGLLNKLKTVDCATRLFRHLQRHELTAMMEAHQKTVEPFENGVPSGRGQGAGPGRGVTR